MTNKEYYKDEIFNIACQGDAIAFDKIANNMVECTTLGCANCKFANQGGCRTAMSKWLEEEYTEPPIDWTKVEVDTKILVSNYVDGEYVNRHFAKYKNGTVYAFCDGCTSWTVEYVDDVIGWKYAKLYDDSQELKNIKVKSYDYDKVVEILKDNGLDER